jgi:hypothetical protein
MSDNAVRESLLAGSPTRLVRGRPDEAALLLACLVGSKDVRAQLKKLASSPVLLNDARGALTDLLAWGDDVLGGAATAAPTT